MSYHSGENLDSMTTPFDLMIGSVRSFRCIFEKRNSQSHNYGPFQTSEAQLERRIGPLLCSHARCAVTKVESVSYLWAEFPVCGQPRECRYILSVFKQFIYILVKSQVLLKFISTLARAIFTKTESVFLRGVSPCL